MITINKKFHQRGAPQEGVITLLVRGSIDGVEREVVCRRPPPGRVAELAARWHATGLRFGVGLDSHPPALSVLDD